jgi:hypothetical protein
MLSEDFFVSEYFKCYMSVLSARFFKYQVSHETFEWALSL